MAPRTCQPLTCIQLFPILKVIRGTQIDVGIAENQGRQIFPMHRKRHFCRIRQNGGIVRLLRCVDHSWFLKCRELYREPTSICTPSDGLMLRMTHQTLSASSSIRDGFHTHSIRNESVMTLYERTRSKQMVTYETLKCYLGIKHPPFKPPKSVYSGPPSNTNQDSGASKPQSSLSYPSACKPIVVYTNLLKLVDLDPANRDALKVGWQLVPSPSFMSTLKSCQCLSTTYFRKSTFIFRALSLRATWSRDPSTSPKSLFASMFFKVDQLVP